MTDFGIFPNLPHHNQIAGPEKLAPGFVHGEKTGGNEISVNSEEIDIFDDLKMDIPPEIEKYIRERQEQRKETQENASSPAVKDNEQLSLFADEKSKTPPQEDSGSVVTITVLHTNDMHGNILPRTTLADTDGMGMVTETVEFGGQPVISSMIKKERKEAEERGEHVLLMDAGDMFMGTPISGMFEGKPVLEIMNKQGYIAATVGNHELDWGLSTFRNLVREANFPFLAANMRDKNGCPIEGVEDYKILRLPGLSIGITGVAAEETNRITSVDEVKEMHFLDPVETLKNVLPRMAREGADFVIILSHSGISEDTRIASELEESELPVPLIIGGHSHDTLHEPVRIGKTYITQTGAGAMNIGKTQLHWDTVNKRLINMNGEMLRVHTDSSEPDSEILDIINKYLEQEEQIMGVSLGDVDVDMHHPSNGEETNLGNLVTDFLREKTGADIAFLNSGSLRSSLPKGRSVSYRDVYNVVPFSSKIVTVDLKGEDILQILERSAGTDDDKSLQVSGLRMLYDSLRPEGKRIMRAETDRGEKLELQALYRVATIDYLAKGGDHYESFTRGEQSQSDFGELQSELAEMISSRKRLENVELGRRVNLRLK